MSFLCDPFTKSGKETNTSDPFTERGTETNTTL